MIYYLTILLCGILFGSGLTISNMVNANKVLDFLDIMGNWDPSLALVMFSALIITWIGYRFVLRCGCPQFAEKFSLPQKQKVDAKLIIGAAIFGTGWGLAGYCPGPAVTALGLGICDAVYFVVGMIASMFIYALISKIK
jgi:uncharacterized protein